MNSRIDDLLVTEQYWFQDGKGNNHCVFAKSGTVARQYARAIGIDLSLTEVPTKISPVTIHNANSWYERVLVPELNHV